MNDVGIKNQKGFTLVEIAMTVAIVGLTALAFSSLFSWYSKTTNRLSTNLEREIDQSTGGDFILRSLSRAKHTLNMITLNDDQEKPFFDFFPSLPFRCTPEEGNSTRTLTLQVGGKTEIYFIEIDKFWKHSLRLDPSRPFNNEKHCLDQNGTPVETGTPLASFNFQNNANATEVDEAGLLQCIKDYEQYDFRTPESLIKANAGAKDLFYVFRLPEYMTPVTPTCQMKSYFYFSYWNGSQFADLRNSGFIEALHPHRASSTNGGLQSINSLSYFIGKLPFSSGASTAFLVDRVRLVLYQLVPVDIKGRKTAALYRYFFSIDANQVNTIETEPPPADPNSATVSIDSTSTSTSPTSAPAPERICRDFGSTQLCATKKILVAQGIEKVVFRRPSVQNPIVNFQIYRDLTETRAIQPKTTTPANDPPQTTEPQ